MQYLTVLDYIVLALVAVGGIWGAIKGFIEELSNKFGYVAGFAVALMFSNYLIPVLDDKFQLPPWLNACLSYVILFVAGFLVIKMIGSILQNIFDTANLTSIDNIAGFIIGVAEAIVLIGLVETLLSHQSLIDLNSYFEQSVISQKLIFPVFNWTSKTVQEAL